MPPKTSSDASSGRRTKASARIQSAGAAALFLLMAGFPLLAPVAEAAPSGGWQVAIPIETDTLGSAGNANSQVAVDGNGNAVAVWYQGDGTRNNIWTSRYAAGSGWGIATLLETDDTGSAQDPQVAVDGAGNAFAVWTQYDGTRNNIWANRYEMGWGWGIVTLIETDNTGSAYAPQVAVDTSGNAVAVWYQSDGTRINILANRYVAGSGWGTATLIETDNAGDAYGAQVAVGGSGNAVAVWYQSDGTRNNVWANRYAAGSGWGTATLIETDNAGDAYGAQVAVDGSGDAVAVWFQNDGSRFNIWANRYGARSGWGGAELIETDNVGHAQSPQVTVDGSGNAVAVWTQSDGAQYNIWANRYAAGSGWGRAELVETDDTGSAFGPQVAVDGVGNMIAVWFQSDGSRENIWANRFVVGTGWGTATLVETDNAGDAFYPQVAADRSGNGVAVWYQHSGAPLNRYNIRANRFVAVDTSPASIMIASPANGSATNLSSIWVAGSAEVGAQVSVNGVAATVEAGGSFGLLVTLRPGLNLLVASAWDASGNHANATVNVTFEDPVPVLQEKLAAAQASMASLETDANATQAQLDAAHANLTAAQASVSTLQASALSAQAALAASQAREAALEANATAAKADLASAQSRIAALETNGTAAPTGGASGDAGLAMLLAAVGIAVGAVGCALALRSRRPVVVKETVAAPAPPPPSPPPP
jgi:hypothetical protein